MFIIEDNILCHLGGPFDHTGSHGNWLNGCKIDLITYPNPCNGSSFSLVFPHFLTFLLIFMNIQMRRFSYRPRSSIHLSYNITGSTTKCQNDSLGLKLVYLWIFYVFSVIFNVFIKIHEYANSEICITYYWMKGLYLSFKMRPISVV